MKASARYREVVSWLKSEWPLSKPVYVRLATFPKPKPGRLVDKAKCTLVDGNKFLIEIEKRQCLDMKLDALIHEWAHAMTWFGAEALGDYHSSEWGLSYARLYRGFFA